jgi:hypothetical protein
MRRDLDESASHAPVGLDAMARLNEAASGIMGRVVEWT